MGNEMDRREFLQRSMLASAGLLVGSALPEVLSALSTTSGSAMMLCAISGEKVFDNTMASVDALGGMKKFVRQNASVGILINSVFDRTGTYANPDIALAVVKMCLDAGAKSVVTIEDTPSSYWRRSSYFEKLRHEIGQVGHSSEKKDIAIAKGRSLKEATVSSSLLSCDVFINIPIIKDHRGTRYTGNLKNVMGAFSSSTCRRCHYGDWSAVTQIFQGAYSKMELLTQSIADLNLVRSPDLCIADVTAILATNGPVGPGRIKKPMEVVAGTNGVAVDMYCVKHLDLDPEELLVIKRAQEHMLGPKSLREVQVMTR